jgi:uncharacterized protein involved in exopolysaccharide biosynthesis
MQKEIELAVASGTFDENNTVVKQIKNELWNLKIKYKEFFTEDSSDKLMPNFHRIPEVGVKFAKLERQIKYYVKLIEYLGPQYEKAKIDELKNVSTIQIIDRATRPERKDKPKRSRIVLAFFALTALVSSYYAYFKERNYL